MFISAFNNTFFKSHVESVNVTECRGNMNKHCLLLVHVSKCINVNKSDIVKCCLCLFSDTICDLGGVDELANYGEYSGAPSEQQTYDYAKTILSLMTSEKHPDGEIVCVTE